VASTEWRRLRQLVEAANQRDRPSSNEALEHEIELELQRIVIHYDLDVMLPTATPLWRARPGSIPRPVRAGDLGTVPSDETRPHRLGPHSKPLFYATENLETAIAEVSAHSPERFITVGRFETSQECKIIDFTKSPERQGGDNSLRQFESELRQVMGQTKWRTEYGATQFIGNFLIAVLGASGIRYRSYRHPTGRCLAMAVPNDRCVDSPHLARAGKLYLVLDPASVIRMPE
jgi:RES domain